MTTIRLKNISDSRLANDVLVGRSSLWLLPGVRQEALAELANLYWENVWNLDPSTDFAELVQNASSGREPLVVSDADADPESFHARKYVRIYQIPMEKRVTASPALQRIKTEQLKLRVSQIGGVLFVVGPIAQHLDDLDIIREVGPQLRICILTENEGADDFAAGSHDIFLWPNTLEDFAEEYESCSVSISAPHILDLKEAKGVEVPAGLLDELGEDWTLVTRDKISPYPVDQGSFDGFLNGDRVWSVFASGGAYLRSLLAPLKCSQDGNRQKIDFLKEILCITHEIDATQVDPRDSLRQLIIFAESGSGITTYLRQLGVLIAQAGYPTLISNSLPRKLSPQSLGRVVGAIQDLWWRNRRGPGTGTGRIPVVILIDKDAENVADGKSIAKLLASIGREIVLVRAFERSRDEMKEAAGAYLLPSEVDEAELLELGRHLREFANRHSLASIPGDSEWLAYHEGVRRIARYSVVAKGSQEEALPYLFLIGISPFIWERIADVNSLEQYFLEKWDALESRNLKAIVQTVAAAGSFNLSVPYNALRRHSDLDLAELEHPHAELHRAIDRFLEWRAAGTNVQGWYLRIRHPVVGKLLCRAIDPVEGSVPYRPIVGVLKQLTTKPDDKWFAESLVYRVGQNFRRDSPSFSLETDTPMQKAARAIFAAIPPSLKDISRPIAHHEARYHIHVIHACLQALEKPQTTTLTAEQIRRILEDEERQSSDWLERALRIQESFEPDSNVYNTYARLKFAYADSLPRDDIEAYREAFLGGIDLQERSIEADSTNGHSIFQFVQQIIEAHPPSDETWSADERLDLLSRAEARLSDLITLQQENRWRNVDPVEAEVQLGSLLARHIDQISKLPELGDKIESFRIRHPEAAIRILIRLLIGSSTFSKAFGSPGKAEQLRAYRDELLLIPQKTARGLLYLYRLFIDDPQGRMCFRQRLSVLTELKRRSRDQFLPYWHDEAALLCQLDNLPEGARRFAELRQFRQAQDAQWFWMNERVLLEPDAPVRLRPLSITALDTIEGWARFQNLNVRFRYQPQHFPKVVRSQTFKAYIRFTLYGLQAVPEELAQRDLDALRAR